MALVPEYDSLVPEYDSLVPEYDHGHIRSSTSGTVTHMISDYTVRWSFFHRWGTPVRGKHLIKSLYGGIMGPKS